MPRWSGLCAHWGAISIPVCPAPRAAEAMRWGPALDADPTEGLGSPHSARNDARHLQDDSEHTAASAPERDRSPKSEPSPFPVWCLLTTIPRLTHEALCPPGKGGVGHGGTRLPALGPLGWLRLGAARYLVLVPSSAMGSGPSPSGLQGPEGGGAQASPRACSGNCPEGGKEEEVDTGRREAFSTTWATSRGGKQLPITNERGAPGEGRFLRESGRDVGAGRAGWVLRAVLSSPQRRGLATAQASAWMHRASPGPHGPQERHED